MSFWQFADKHAEGVGGLIALAILAGILIVFLVLFRDI